LAILVAAVVSAAGCDRSIATARAETPMAKAYPVHHTDAEWRTILSAAQYDVLRSGGTERAFTGKYSNFHGKTLFVCAACGAPLFTSDSKFDSGTGWPSFWEPVNPGAIETVTDTTFGMERTEVRCARCGSHLGHVFDDGPKPTGLRYCINSVSLKTEDPKATPGPKTK
jgi:peptide-methionine (R)-S-oxide reductase